MHFPNTYPDLPVYTTISNPSTAMKTTRDLLAHLSSQASFPVKIHTAFSIFNHKPRIPTLPLARARYRQSLAVSNLPSRSNPFLPPPCMHARLDPYLHNSACIVHNAYVHMFFCSVYTASIPVRPSIHPSILCTVPYRSTHPPSAHAAHARHPCRHRTWSLARVVRDESPSCIRIHSTISRKEIP
jgi:hypothetical protein